MLCKIADLITEVPEAGDLVPRCKDYLWNSTDGADVIIRTDLFHPEYWPGASENLMIYMESGCQFYGKLLGFHGMMLHASAVEMHGKAFLFSGPSGMGKSTHTRLWQQVFGTEARVFNDDKPALRFLDGKWYAYGTPWCGKDSINKNVKVPLVGICFLKQAAENRIRRLDVFEAMQKIVSQTHNKFRRVEMLDQMLENVERLASTIPVFELENKPESDAAKMSYETMNRAAMDICI